MDRFMGEGPPLGLAMCALLELLSLVAYKLMYVHKIRIPELTQPLKVLIRNQYILQHVEDTLRRHPEWKWQTRPSPINWLSYHGAVLTRGQVAPLLRVLPSTAALKTA